MNNQKYRAIGYMVASMALFVVSDTLMKLASDDVPAAQMLVVRGAILGTAVLVVLWRSGLLVHVREIGHPDAILRTLCEGAGTVAYILSLAHIPIATALAIHMSTPLFVLPFAAWILGERIGALQISAVTVGLLGVMLVLQPAAAGPDHWVLVSATSAVLFALRDTMTRRLRASLPSMLVMAAGIAAGILAASIDVAARGWEPVSRNAWFAAAGSAVFVGFGMLFLIRSMRGADVSMVSPFRYTAIIWATASGYLVWGTLPDFWTIGGVSLICVGGLIALRLARINAKDRAPQASD